MKKFCLLLTVILISIMLMSCSNANEPGQPTESPTATPAGDTVSVDFYYYYDTEDDKDIISFEKADISLENMVDDTIFHMKEINDIQINDLWFEGNKICVDLNTSESYANFLQGSTGAYITTNILLRTFFSFPDVDEIEFLLDGKQGAEGDHFNFDHIFKPEDLDLYSEYIEIRQP